MNEYMVLQVSWPAKMEQIEREVIEAALLQHNGSTGAAARQLGLSQRKIQYKLKDWGKQSSDYKRDGKLYMRTYSHENGWSDPEVIIE